MFYLPTTYLYVCRFIRKKYDNYRDDVCVIPGVSPYYTPGHGYILLFIIIIWYISILPSEAHIMRITCLHLIAVGLPYFILITIIDKQFLNNFYGNYRTTPPRTARVLTHYFFLTRIPHTMVTTLWHTFVRQKRTQCYKSEWVQSNRQNVQLAIISNIKNCPDGTEKQWTYSDTNNIFVSKMKLGKLFWNKFQKLTT